MNNRSTDINTMSKTLVNFILRNAQKFEWSVQGLGMLRLHLPDNARLHIWHSSLKVPNVSELHDHAQWGLTSHIIAGSVCNHIYYEGSSSQYSRGVGDIYNYTVLKAGYGCKFMQKPKRILLVKSPSKLYKPSEFYKQEPDVIHRTEAEDGTITFMQKRPTDTDTARVFWPTDAEWVSAEPRKATPEEIERVTASALMQLVY